MAGTITVRTVDGESIRGDTVLFDGQTAVIFDGAGNQSEEVLIAEIRSVIADEPPEELTAAEIVENTGGADAD